MTDLATQVAGLTTSVNALTSAVNVAKATLDASVSAAGTSATTAQAAVTTAASSATAAQTAQAAAAAVSGLSNLNGFLGQIQASAPVAVFWYDTTRDSDGGAWRKRCAAKSWATMALGTSTRGSRADFPAQALFVVDSNNIVTLYDCDQSTPAMWAKIGGPGKAVDLSGGVAAIWAFNGVMWVGGANGLFTVPFVGSEMITRSTAGGTAPRAYGVANANAASMTEVNVPGAAALVGNTVTAVAAVTLSGAPIDRATGLPKPTVAVATTSGISVIHASGQVVSLTGVAASSLSLDGAAGLLRFAEAGNQGVNVGPIPYVTTTASAWRAIRYSTASIPTIGIAWSKPLAPLPGGFALGAPDGTAPLTLVSEDPVNPAAGMVAFITAPANTANGGGAFNTGMIVGDCRLALSSTSTASMAASGELVSNGTFTSTTGWIAANGATLTASGGTLTITSTGTDWGGAYQTLTGLAAGKTYLVQVAIGAGTYAGAVRIGVGTAPGDDSYGYMDSIAARPVSVLAQVTATSAGTAYIQVGGATGFLSGQTVLVSQVSLQLAEPDRSAKAVGMRVAGTLTKALVATTTDLSAWSGFSTSNYLYQPYNSGLDFGAGDFSVALWVKCTSAANVQLLFGRRGATGAWWQGYLLNSTGQVRLGINDGTSFANTTSSRGVADGVWHQLVFVMRARTAEIWIDGVRDVAFSYSTFGSLSSTSAPFTVGALYDGSQIADSSAITLLRISATAATPEQIARMYADERPLFQPGAKCVLGGTSAAVQGLAHDPDTGALYAAKGDGTSVFQGLVRIAHLTGLATTSNSDNHTAVSARQGGYVIATANQAVASQPAITFRDRILADRVPVAPIDPNRVAFPAVATTDATPTVVARLPLAEGDELQLFVDVEATEYGATPTERMGYQRRARVYRLPNGNVTVATVQTLGTDYESATTTCDVTVVADTTSQTVCVQATGVAAKRLAWSALVHVNRSGATRYAA
ncbi:concanavalin A-like lectin/glucanase superfamily protein [Nitrospirillum amazonense]|uniref:Concanavalin A-like lectin/glucanase superfamily protein n=1 Tax=Nitrospirillum amazonense TaxID=28077 RepID=A0A560FGF1_9PROT|nr:LamG domain-containing protein [Nitrospirillum amazonense]TWB20686.1 concanavalin A-like lectin/glucanase superfamily protein [Nitrospirillum amazonense]